MDLGRYVKLSVAHLLQPLHRPCQLHLTQEHVCFCKFVHCALDLPGAVIMLTLLLLTCHRSSQTSRVRGQ